MAKTVSVKESDYLDCDPPIRGQNFACLSFVSPQDVLKKKEVFFFEEFLKNFSNEMNEFFDNLSQKYKDEADVVRAIKDRYQYIFNREHLQEEYNFFVKSHNHDIEQAFYEKNDFQTSIQGIKIRGVYDTLKEAEVRCQVLKKVDPNFNVFVGAVGAWLPWSPNADDIADSEYAETHLNTLMKNYKENQEKKDVFYEERKRELQFMNTKKKMEDEDTWMQRKTEEAEASSSKD